MCAIAGFFVACGAQPKCAECGARGVHFNYKSPFKYWKTEHERRGFDLNHADVADDKEIFPSALVPVLRHPLCRDLGATERSKLLAFILGRYLLFTINLETMIVNDVTKTILLRQTPFCMPEEMIRDAYKIYMDEAYHAFLCGEMVGHVRALGQDIIEYSSFPFVAAYRQLADNCKPEDSEILRQFHVIVSEILITATLKEAKNSPRVAESVRELVKLHARDEGRHHKYYSQYFFNIWPQLDSRQRLLVARKIPDIVSSFLDPDRQNIILELRTIGFGEDAARQIVEETYTSDVVNADKRASAHSLLVYLRHTGMTEAPEVADAFAAHGLLVPERLNEATSC